MGADFHRHIDTRKIYGYYRRFLMWFIPLVIVLFAAVSVAVRKEHPDMLPGMIFCGGGAALLTWWIVSTIYRDSEAGQTYEIRDGRVRYESPSMFLGKSFDLALDDIVGAAESDEGDGFEFEITTSDGTTVRCHGDEPETQEFYAELLRRIDSN